MLPVVNEQKYNVTLPISKKKLEIRPWLVKEEKRLLIAKESKDTEKVIDAVYQAISDCTFGENVEVLPMVDVEYLMLKIKSYSNGEIAKVKVRCRNPVGEKKNQKPCGHVAEVDLDLEKDMQIENTNDAENYTKKIPLTDTIGLVMKPPEFSVFRELMRGKSMTELTYGTLAACIDYVWQGDEIFKNFTPEEAESFVENFTDVQVGEMTEYMNGLPKVILKHHFKCSKCKYEQDFTLENLFNFFIE